MKNGKRATRFRPKDDAALKVFNVRVSPALWNQFKAGAVLRGVTLQRELADALEYWRLRENRND